VSQGVCVSVCVRVCDNGYVDVHSHLHALSLLHIYTTHQTHTHSHT
jgi:hypothetical protein